MSMPVLYSFRRCPYAMRARLALHYAGMQVELREILLKDKPESMLSASPKGTVPLLVLADGQVIDESLDVVYWALGQRDPNGLLAPTERDLINQNDCEFKGWLDRYKYHVGYPEHPPEYYRQQAEVFLAKLESILSQHDYLACDKVSVLDICIWPFIRQFAFVDAKWFWQANYPALQRWLQGYLDSDAFTAIMPKFNTWQVGDDITLFPAQ